MTASAAANAAPAPCCGALPADAKVSSKVTPAASDPAKLRIQNRVASADRRGGVMEGAVVAIGMAPLENSYPQSHRSAPDGFSSLQFGQTIFDFS